jgi:hypothetical protein
MGCGRKKAHVEMISFFNLDLVEKLFWFDISKKCVPNLFFITSNNWGGILAI